MLNIVMMGQVIVGAFTVGTAALRAMGDDDVGMTCVLDTPILGNSDQQLSHADLLWSEATPRLNEGGSDDDPHEAKRLAFEDKLARTLQSNGTLHLPAIFPDIDLSNLLPKVVKERPEDYPAVIQPNPTI